LAEMRRRLLKIAEGASLATGAGLKYRDYENPFDDMINVKCLTSLCRHHFEDLGIEGFVPEEQYPGSGSSDIGNVSYICPTVYCEIALEGEGDPVVVHEKSALSLVNSPRASKLMEKVVRAYTYSAIDLCLDDTLCQKAREEHRKNVELHQWEEA
jgi:metal-dependent amidase/aminoacylase/carboxypeptidase family protein